MLVMPEAIEQVVVRIFEAAGCEAAEAATIARNLVDANLTGHDSHGVIRVQRYIEYIESGEVVPGQHATVVFETDSIVIVDGNKGFGQVIAEETMTLLAAKAKKSGLAMSSIRNSGHLGRIGGWAEQLSREGLVSLHFMSTTGRGMLVTPFGGSDRRLSLNPISIGVPIEDRDMIMLDFTTAMCAEGKLAVARNKGARMPPDFIIDKDGRPTDDPNDVYDGGAVLPFGGYKGSGLNIVTDLLAGALSGGGCTRAGTTELVSNMTSIAIDPAALTDTEHYMSEIKRYTDWVKQSPPKEPDGEVLLPGEIEHRTRAERRRDGIPIDAASWTQILDAAELVGLQRAPLEARATGA